MPDLTLSFVNPRLLDDVSFHPCVRFKRWEVRFAAHFLCIVDVAFICSQSERVLSFVPPDGNFRLMSYHIGANK